MTSIKSHLWLWLEKMRAKPENIRVLKAPSCRQMGVVFFPAIIWCSFGEPGAHYIVPLCLLATEDLILTPVPWDALCTAGRCYRCHSCLSKLSDSTRRSHAAINSCLSALKPVIHSLLCDAQAGLSPSSKGTSSEFL